MDEKETASTEQLTMAATTAASTSRLKGVRSRFFSIFSPAERIR